MLVGYMCMHTYMSVSWYMCVHACIWVCTDLFRELPDLLQDGLYWSAPLSASCERDDTETAHVLTPTHYGTGNKNAKLYRKKQFHTEYGTTFQLRHIEDPLYVAVNLRTVNQCS